MIIPHPIPVEQRSACARLQTRMKGRNCYFYNFSIYKVLLYLLLSTNAISLLSAPITFIVFSILILWEHYNHFGFGTTKINILPHPCTSHSPGHSSLSPLFTFNEYAIKSLEYVYYPNWFIQLSPPSSPHVVSDMSADTPPPFRSSRYAKLSLLGLISRSW